MPALTARERSITWDDARHDRMARHITQDTLSGSQASLGLATVTACASPLRGWGHGWVDTFTALVHTTQESHVQLSLDAPREGT